VSTFEDTLVCVGLRHIVTVAFFCAVCKYSYLITVLTYKSYCEKLSGTFFIWTRCRLTLLWTTAEFFFYLSIFYRVMNNFIHHKLGTKQQKKLTNKHSKTNTVKVPTET